jgi:hypothetical protein
MVCSARACCADVLTLTLMFAKSLDIPYFAVYL